LQIYMSGPPESVYFLIDCDRGGKPTSRAHRTGEQLYTPSEIGRVWSLKPVFIRHMFGREPDIIWVKRSDRSRKRRFVSMLIPESVAQRVGQNYGLPVDHITSSPGCEFSD
jgi:hypothetical protein